MGQDLLALPPPVQVEFAGAVKKYLPLIEVWAGGGAAGELVELRRLVGPP